VWIGDDAAVMGDGSLFATDALVAGVHFDLRWCSAADVGWKALAVNCSDIAAMGGTPVAAVAALVLPAEPPGLADEVAAGLAEAAAAFSCPLVGGDTTSGPVLVVTVAVVGRSPASGAVLRRGARPDDTVFVTGQLGAAKVALDAHRAGEQTPAGTHERMVRPAPRLAAGIAAAAGGATAMIDISDGLAADLGHILDGSGVGVEIVGNAVPRGPGVSLDAALYGGDDYELCFTAPDPEVIDRAFSAAGLARPARLGVCRAGSERWLVVGGTRSSLSSQGWEHPIP
jgi:thiamine-monophosphate kinase